MKQKMYSCDARVILSILIGLFLSCNVFAQDVTIKGNVKDAKGEPIIGASILEKGTTNGTVTDFDGNFMLSAPKGSTIGISYIGYKSQDIINQGQSNLIVVLQEDTEVLDEIVVIGYGTVKKDDATGSVTAIKPDKMNRGLTTTATDIHRRDGDAVAQPYFLERERGKQSGHGGRLLLGKNMAKELGGISVGKGGGFGKRDGRTMERCVSRKSGLTAILVKKLME